MLLIALIVILSTVFLTKYVKWRNIYLIYKYPKMKSYYHIPLLGHLGFLRYANLKIKDIGPIVKHFSEESGRMGVILGITVIPLTKAEHFEKILNHPNCNNKSFTYRFLHDVMKDSLLCLEDKPWRLRRKAMAPLMQGRVVGHFVEDISKYAEQLAERFTNKIGMIFNAEPDIAKNTFDMFINVVIGIDQGDNEYGDKYLHYATWMTTYFVERSFTVLKYFDFIFKQTTDAIILKKASNFINNVVTDFMNKRKVVCQETKIMGAAVEESNLPLQYRVIDYLINMNLVDDAIRNESTLFISAGFETSATTTSFTLLTLAMHPDIQGKTYQEVMNVLGPERSVQYSDINNFVYLKKVINETMRIFPPVPHAVRVNSEELEIDGNIIPKNTNLYLCIIGAHRCPVQWPNPLKFDPERFNPDQVKLRSSYSHVPFLAGPRSCFGAPFAMASVITTVAVLVRKFEWSTPYKSIEEIELELALTLKCSKGINLQPKLRG